jgi:two-component system, OmpR family, sensor kinase
VVQWPSTLRWRLTIWYTALLGVPLIVLAIGFYTLFARTLASHTDQFIGDALTAFSRELIAERRASLGTVEAIRSTVEEVRFRDLHIAVLDSAGAVVSMTPIPADERHAGNEQEQFDRWIGDALRGRVLDAPGALTVPGQQARYRVITRPVTLGAQRFLLTGAYSTADTAAVLDRIRGVLLILLPLLIAGAATGGYFLAVRGLAPVAAMAARAEEISATNLKERLPVSGGEELAGLARIINELLERLESSFTHQRRFASEASHELRTPTAILRTEADVTLQQAHRSEAEYRASMIRIRDAARRLTRIVDDLFVLARAEPENVAARRESIYLEEIVHDAIEAVRRLADARHVRVELGAAIEASFAGDPDLLDRLLLNLLDNAIKHSPKNGRVVVEMARCDGEIQIRVSDEGHGIPVEDQGRVFERFVRLDASEDQPETELPTGAGLGLAIARRIAEAHGGQLDLPESRPGRTVFRVRLPTT